jgi:hypothetical protein
MKELLFSFTDTQEHYALLDWKKLLSGKRDAWHFQYNAIFGAVNANMTEWRIDTDTGTDTNWHYQWDETNIVNTPGIQDTIFNTINVNQTEWIYTENNIYNTNLGITGGRYL